ncbi:hypothetical protein CRG98_014068 [Punica granatum]|uniref:Uncharacterized protein n=1 Tax=Punica granatum TaxID=22663 RepID=A0A2I0KAJ9_PUNGR|nr:hypothetical protein CRG98_014068 [Punica granatum]
MLKKRRNQRPLETGDREQRLEAAGDKEQQLKQRLEEVQVAATRDKEAATGLTIRAATETTVKSWRQEVQLESEA